MRILKKTLVVDIDGTICSKTNGDYERAEPFEDRIEQINRLYDKGYNIIYFTARGMGRSHNDRDLAIEKFYDLTFRQLSDWGCRYDSLVLGKPAADFYIDDKSINSEDFFDLEMNDIKRNMIQHKEDL